MKNISIVIADDHGVLRGGLRALLHDEPDFRVVGEAADGDCALQLACELKPDVLLADISMPGPSGIGIADRLRGSLPQTKVVILTMHDDTGLVEEARRVGAKGFVSKRAAETELIKAIRTVVDGGSYWPQSTGIDQRPEMGDLGSKAMPELEPHDVRLLMLIAQACTNGQIAAELHTTTTVVEGWRRELMGKLGFRNRVDIVRYAHEHKLI